MTALNPMASQAMLSGFLTSMGLIVAIGAQNAYVLKLGLLKQHVFPIALLCATIDALLILLGVTFAGFAVQAYPNALNILRYIGVGFLLYYGYKAFVKAYRHAQPDAQAPMDEHITLRSAIVTCLAMTLLNPHVYLDTFLLIGGVSAQFIPYQYFYAIGALSGSFVWFFSLGYGARLLSPLFAKAKTWMILETLIGIVMWTIAYKIWTMPL